VLKCVAVCCSVLQCGAVWCNMVQYGAVWCSVLQCAAARRCVHGAKRNESWHTNACVMAHTGMSLDAHMNASWRMNRCIVAHVCALKKNSTHIHKHAHTFEIMGAPRANMWALIFLFLWNGCIVAYLGNQRVLVQQTLATQRNALFDSSQINGTWPGQKKYMHASVCHGAQID